MCAVINADAHDALPVPVEDVLAHVSGRGSEDVSARDSDSGSGSEYHALEGNGTGPGTPTFRPHFLQSSLPSVPHE